MKRLSIIAMALALSACSMTPTQQRWLAFGVGVVATGAIIAHETDQGRGNLAMQPTSSGGKTGPFNPCPSGISAECK
ncbi:MAG TPA: hypothetical protein VFO36_00425 [Nitrospiraceae bacterium]|nr:hypothetical protein [Nitrospiraceae bacterium]